MFKATLRLKEMGALLRSSDPISLIETLQTPVRELAKLTTNKNDQAKILSYGAFHAHQKGDHVSALSDFQQAFNLDGQIQSLTNALIVARKAKQAVSATDRKNLLALAEKAAEKSNDSVEAPELFDVLCHNLGEWGDIKAAAKWGEKSLRLKDAAQSKSFDLVDRSRPKFDFGQPSRNVIAFSLFGKKPRYLTVSLENAKACRYVYPGWICRFYVDKSVPQEALAALAAQGAQVCMMPQLHDSKTASGLFWRFLVASDPNVDFFMIRDADSLISVREKNAVDEWVASNCDFHVLRDFYTHSELILAGLWGGVAGRIPNINDMINAYHAAKKPKKIGVHNHDQLFLRTKIWPTIKASLMQHDSVFCMDGKDPNIRNFPSVGALQPERHVGQNMGIFMKNGGEN